MHLAQGDLDQAFAWLDRAVVERSEWLVYLRVDPSVDPLRDDPRFAVLLRRVGLAPWPGPAEARGILPPSARALATGRRLLTRATELPAPAALEGSGKGSEVDRARLLAKLRCPTCGGAGVEYPDGPRCPSGHAFSAAAPVRRHRPFGERVFDHPQALGFKVATLSLLNGIPPGTLDPVTAGSEVLDLGCGSHQYQYRPERAALRLGIDLSARCIASAQRLYPGSLHLVGSLADPLPLADDSFDVVLFIAVLHHLPRAIVPAVLQEAARVARREVVVLDHTRSDVAWQRAIQLRYWETFDGGDLYRSQAEWDQLLSGWRVLEHRRLGVLFRNVCVYRLAV